MRFPNQDVFILTVLESLMMNLVQNYVLAMVGYLVQEIHLRYMDVQMRMQQTIIWMQRINN